MEIDLKTIIISAVIWIVGFFLIFYNLLSLQSKKIEIVTYKGIFQLISISLATIVFAVIGNSLLESRWGIEYIISFISFKIVGEWLFRVILSLGYMIFLWGVVIIIVLAIRSERWT